MTTPNEQPVSDTPLTDEIWEEFSTSGHINHDMVFRHARELERKLNQANQAYKELDNQFIAQSKYCEALEAVARAADNGCLCCGTNAHSNLRESIDVLKSKGWK